MSQSTGPQSWIVEVRRLLASGALPSIPLETERLLLVPVFVDGGALWTVLGRDRSGRAGFPAVAAEPEALEEAAQDAGEEHLGLPRKLLLPLGSIGPVPSAEVPTIAWAAAIPGGFALEPGDDLESLHRLPLASFTAPRLVEERVTPRGATEVLHHVGGLVVGGDAVAVVGELWRRLTEGPGDR